MDESNQTNDAHDWLTRRQTARLIGCSLRTVDNYLVAGKLTKHLVRGGLVRVHRKEVESLITPIPVVPCADR